MYSIVFVFLNPLLFILLFSSICQYFLPKKRNIIFGFAALLTLIFSIPFPVEKIVQKREFSILPLNGLTLYQNEHYYMLVLGAGKNNDTLLSGNLRLCPEVLTRLVEGVKWSKKLNRFTLVCSGPLGDEITSQAQLLQETAVILGVNEKQIQLIDEGYNTKAEQFIEKFDKSRPLILCTSALHMRRAIAWFNYFGARSIYPAPSSYTATHEPFSLYSFIPCISSFFSWQQYLKEVFGTWMVPKPD